MVPSAVRLRFQRERCSFFPSVLEASAAIAAAANNLWREVSTAVEREADGRAGGKEEMVYVGEGEERGTRLSQ